MPPYSRRLLRTRQRLVSDPNMTALARLSITLGAILALAGCTAQAPRQSATIDPATGLPGCISRDGLLPTSGGRIEQSPNSLPPGAKDMSQSCDQRNVAQPYLTH
jgi:hypothetical protein